MYITYNSVREWNFMRYYSNNSTWSHSGTNDCFGTSLLYFISLRFYMPLIHSLSWCFSQIIIVWILELCNPPMLNARVSHFNSSCFFPTTSRLCNSLLAAVFPYSYDTSTFKKVFFSQRINYLLSFLSSFNSRGKM